MSGTGRYTHFAERVVTTATKPFAAAKTRTAAIEFLLALALLLALPAAANATAITEFPLPAGATPGPPTAGPDGNVWFTVGGSDPGIDRITPAGAITHYSTGMGSTPVDVTLGAEGNLWAGDIGLHAIWKITSTGTLTEYTGVAMTVKAPEELTLGADGNVWFLDGGNNALGSVTPAGTITEYANPSAASTLNALAAGAGKTLWFTDQNPSAIGEINLAGPTPQITAYATAATAFPNDITLGTDGNMWFTDDGTPSQIGRITPSGTITEFGTIAGLSLDAEPDAITVGPNGNVWFDDQNANSRGVGQVTPAGQITEYHAGLTDGLPDDLTFGIDGNLWVPQEVSMTAPATVDRITTSGVVTNFTTGVNPNGGFDGDSIITGPDGNLWFSDGGSPPSIGKISLQLPPTVTTDPATAIGNSGATVTATVAPLGSATDLTFQYGTSPMFGSTVDTGTVPASGSSSDVSATLANLPSGTTVYYRPIATSAFGTAAGATQTFTTTGQMVPIGSTNPSTTPTAPSTTPPTNPKPKPTKKPKAVSATAHLILGNQRLTLVTPQPQKPYACFATTTSFTAKLSTGKLRKGTKLHFLSATLTLDATHHLVRHLPANESFSLKKSKSGVHALKIALTFQQPTQKRKPHHKQGPLKRTWTTRFRVC